jgi:hypothetical protein
MWLRHVFGMQELDPCREITVLKAEDTRRVAKPTLRWRESVEEYLKNMSVRRVGEVINRTERSGG